MRLPASERSVCGRGEFCFNYPAYVRAGASLATHVPVELKHERSHRVRRWIHERISRCLMNLDNCEGNGWLLSLPCWNFSHWSSHMSELNMEKSKFESLISLVIRTRTNSKREGEREVYVLTEFAKLEMNKSRYFRAKLLYCGQSRFTHLRPHF